MNEILMYALGSALIVSVASLIGATWLTVSSSRLNKAVPLLVSLAAGVMLGNALLHLLPHSLEHSAHGDIPAAVHVEDSHDDHGHDAAGGTHDDHDHDAAGETHNDHGHDAAGGAHDDHDHDAAGGAHDDHDHDAAGGAHDDHGHPGLGVAALILAGFLGLFALDLTLLSIGRNNPSGIKPSGYLVLLSDGLENMIDGVLIGTAYLVSIPLGVATTIAVFVHEIPIEMGDFGVLVNAGFSKKKALLMNFLSGLLCLAGVLIAVFAFAHVATFTAVATPLAAGAFLYLAGTALLPQIREHGGSMAKLYCFAMTLAGVGVMALLLLIE